ncbi:S8 family serine peptidase [Methylobacterium sp. 17Sr1-1]|uniref:S8 family serine peptidase n=1 Tax=Methylobacterium sp. 17Sr1-1 TaxID=2202826 RepID=UPI000D6FE07A|nr:S8 family serine peptidase [Methylobacterium sp. 17Sr1-1]AWN55283.1 protease [Methylobacterium sp. 17Sr1-1]
MTLKNSFPEPPRPQPTGRYIVTFDTSIETAQAQTLIENRTGIRTFDMREIGDTRLQEPGAAAPEGGAIIERFKVAVIQPQDGIGARMASLRAESGVKEVRPEFYLFAINELERRYAAWVREGLSILANGFPEAAAPVTAAAERAAAEAAAFADTDQFTWGLQAVGADRTPYTGKGVRVAVLATGLNFHHPDFAGRAIVSQSFVPDHSVQDVQGHGTHTAGTLAGPAVSKVGRRYGVAPDVELHIGKVLDDRGAGAEFDVVDGMNWAIDQKCAVISMSAGRPTRPNETFDSLYERAGRAALKENCLIIAAAGNESARDYGYIAPIGAPANSPSIMAVGAVDPRLKVAPFSCGAVNEDGKALDLVGPGMSVYSAFPEPRQSRTLQGTSMACPHIAGVAALLAESSPSLRGASLRQALIAAAREIGPARDYGHGLVQALRSVGV